MVWVALAVAAVIVVASWRHVRAADRQRTLMLLCDHAGLAFAPLDTLGDTLWLPFAMFGHDPSGSENVVWDRARGPAVRAFDLWYEDPTRDRGRGARRRLTCAVVPLGVSAPPMRIAPRDLADDARHLLSPPIELELASFNERFAIDCEDERFAVAFLEQRMMEALLALPEGVSVETNEDTLLLWAPLLEPEKVLRLYDAAVEILERIPRSLPSLYPPHPDRGPHETRWLQGHWSAEPTAG
jgi:hypothetical protein